MVVNSRAGPVSPPEAVAAAVGLPVVHDDGVRGKQAEDLGFVVAVHAVDVVGYYGPQPGRCGCWGRQANGMIAGE
jgi:hypothetical protein